MHTQIDIIMLCQTQNIHSIKHLPQPLGSKPPQLSIQIPIHVNPHFWCEWDSVRVNWYFYHFNHRELFSPFLYTSFIPLQWLFCVSGCLLFSSNPLSTLLSYCHILSHHLALTFLLYSHLLLWMTNLQNYFHLSCIIYK